MKTKEVNESIIGKKCECIFTGMIIEGVIDSFASNETVTTVEITYDRPHIWGGHIYTKGVAWARNHDEFGSLKFLQILN